MTTKTLKWQPGVIDPEEYNWREQFAELNTLQPLTMMDTGKVLGLALALDEALEELASLRRPG